VFVPSILSITMVKVFSLIICAACEGPPGGTLFTAGSSFQGDGGVVRWDVKSGNGGLLRLSPDSKEGKKLSGMWIRALLNMPKSSVGDFVVCGGNGWQGTHLLRVHHPLTVCGTPLTGATTYINKLLYEPGSAWGDVVLSGGDDGEILRFTPNSNVGEKLSGPSQDILQLLPVSNPAWGVVVLSYREGGEVLCFSPGGTEGQKLSGKSQQIVQLLHVSSPAWGNSLLSGGDDGEVLRFESGSTTGTALTGPTRTIRQLLHVPSPAWKDAVHCGGDNGELLRFMQLLHAPGHRRVRSHRRSGSHTEGQKLTGATRVIEQLLHVPGPTWSDVVLCGGGGYGGAQLVRFYPGSTEGEKLHGALY